MSLFPAYASKDADDSRDLAGKFDLEDQDWQQDATDSREKFLLASDDEDNSKAQEEPSQTAPHSPLCQDFYLDTKIDRGNLRVSTLYYPGRPQYSVAGDEREARRARKRRACRYFDADSTAAVADAADDAEVTARVAAFRGMLADNPCDEDLWLRFIDFQERWRGGAAALAAAEEAAARRPAARALRLERWRLAAAHLPADRYLAALRDHIRTEKSSRVQLELWERLVRALAAAPGGDAAAPAAAVGAALAHSARGGGCALAYPRLLFVYGEFLQAAGLWERLVLLLELVLAMSFPPSEAFPPRPDPPRAAAVERRLRQHEDELIASGLPLSTVWARVERARAAAHWRPAAAADDAELAADPQRAPLAADVAELLRPVADARARFLLLVQALRLAKVPPLPAAGYVLRAVGGAVPTGGEALLPLVRAARRLPAAHPARAPSPASAAAALAALVDPPHYFSDDTGFLSWVEGLWEAAGDWTGGSHRLALLCWRLRWLHALALLAEPADERGRAELRRLRGVARAALRQHAGGAALPFALFARLEAAAAGPRAGRAAALHALRAALRDAACPVAQRLLVARVVSELGAAVEGQWAVACAVLGRAAPSDDELSGAPPPRLLADALNECERRCDEVERTLAEAARAGEEAAEEDACAALLPGAAEWAGARALLAPPARRRELCDRLLALSVRDLAAAAAERYYEQSACALARAAAAHQRAARTARALAPRHPHSALLALLGEGAPLWARDAGAEARPAGARRAAHCAALAALLPPLLRAPPARWPPRDARRVARAARRHARAAAGGAPLLALWLEAEARAERPAPARALYAALDAAPHAKWLYVRGAQWCGAEAAALADLLLERQLRLHALRDELEPLPAAAAAATAAATAAAATDTDRTLDREDI